MTTEERIAALAALPDDEIDFSDAPEAVDWRNAVRGLFHPSTTVEALSDALAGLDSTAPGYEQMRAAIHRQIARINMREEGVDLGGNDRRE